MGQAYLNPRHNIHHLTAPSHIRLLNEQIVEAINALPSEAGESGALSFLHDLLPMLGAILGSVTKSSKVCLPNLTACPAPSNKVSYEGLPRSRRLSPPPAGLPIGILRRCSHRHARSAVCEGELVLSRTGLARVHSLGGEEHFWQLAAGRVL